jgi:hypothetical protein
MGLLRLCCRSLLAHTQQQHAVCASCPPRLFERREKIPHTFAEGDALCLGAACGAYCVAIYICHRVRILHLFIPLEHVHDLRWWKCTPRAWVCVEQGVLFVHSTLATAALLSAHMHALEMENAVGCTSSCKDMGFSASGGVVGSWLRTMSYTFLGNFEGQEWKITSGSILETLSRRGGKCKGESIFYAAAKKVFKLKK